MSVECVFCGMQAEEHSKTPEVKCNACNSVFHKAVAEEKETLESLSERDDKIAEFAQRLLETGGIIGDDLPNQRREYPKGIDW